MSEQPVPFAMKCNATGPGIGGGAAGVEAQFTITCADEDGARIRTGGAKIQISVLRVGLHASTSGDCPIPTRIVDNNDGSYTCGYTVDGRGDYSVSAELDGSPIAGSPYPVFFSGIPGQMTSVKPIPGVVPGVVPGEGGDAPGAAPASESEPIEVTTAQLHVGNLTMNVTAAQLRQLFAHCGEVMNARMQHGKQYGFVEMATVEQARSALKLNGMPLDGRNMRVEPAASVRQQPNPHEPPFKPTAAQFAVVESAADAAAREHQNRLNKALELQANLHAQRAAEMAAKRAEGGDAEGEGRGRSPKDERGGRGRSPKDERGGRGRSRSRTQSPRRDDRNRTRSPVKRRRSRSRSRDRGRDRSRDRDRDSDRDRYKPYSRGKRRGGKYGSGGPRNMNPNGVGQ